MIFKDITNQPLFDSILEFEIGSEIIDIHNNFDIDEIIYQNNIFTIILKSKSLKKIEIKFEEALITEMILNKLEDTIDNFYRGKYEYDGELYDTYNNNRCFYVDFINGSSICLLSKHAQIILNPLHE